MKFYQFLVWCTISLFAGIEAVDHCLPSDNESVLQTNTVYVYHFKSVALAQAVGTTEDQGKVVLDCNVRISHDRKCYYNLELQDCFITATGGEPGFESPWLDKKSLPELSRYHIAFSLVKGEVKDVQVHEDDPLYYVNIKRGVLSAFVFKLSQTKKDMDQMHTDIHGTCPQKSVPSKDVEGEVKTSKDMLHCQFPSRPDWQFSPWSLFWNMSFIQNVINSTTNCSYKVAIAEKRIEHVFCHERHAIMLESTHHTTTAVQTNIFYYMDFSKSEVQNSVPVFVDLTRTTDIRYEYENTPVPQTSSQDFLRIAVKMLSDLVLDSVDEIRLFTISQFVDFVAWIRSSHDLTPLLEKVKYCEFLPAERACDDRIKELALSYVSDALVQCNSLPCVQAIVHLAKNDDLSPTYLNFIYHTWSYMHYSKPGFITNFVDICRSKDSHQCWLSVGAFARRIYSRGSTLDEIVLQEIKDVANFFHKNIKENCEGSNSIQRTNCLVFLKAASNLGKSYSKIVPDGMSRLLEYVTRDHSPTFVRISVVEAIKEVCDANNEQQGREIYDAISPILQNSSLPSSLRILCYDQLMLGASEVYHFENVLISILKEENNPEVKFYIADNLNSLFDDHQFRAKHKRFMNSLRDLLHENRLSLEVIMYKTKAKSRTSSNSVVFKLPFLPDSLKRFGVKVTESRLFDSFIYPTVMSEESILQLFSNFIPTSHLSSYFEGWEELLLAYRKNIAHMDFKSASMPEIFQAVVQTLEEYGSKDGFPSYFDQTIIANIKKIHDLYWQHHGKLNPYAKAYLDLFGSTIKYMIQDSFRESSVNKDLARMLRFLRKDLEEGITYNTTRVVRVIEAYHQVPTMMGLPLNWTTNATLAFSMRAGIKYQMNIIANQVHSKGFFQPSAALTFLNRMVLDFPTLTQIGVQANSSGYTSTELKLQYDSSNGKQSLRLERPLRTQKVLELFRRNQLIKHNSYDDISDWDIERTSSSWCSKASTNSIAGLQMCFSKSYPNVTHRIKPWALMAGSCKWQLLLHPVDQNEVYYDVELQQIPKKRSKEYMAKLAVTEKEKEKAVHFKMNFDENGKDMKLELKTSLMPNFLAAVTLNEIITNRKVLGQKFEALLQVAKDFKYELKYFNEEKFQKSQSASIKGDTSIDDDSQILSFEEQFSFSTPYNVYKGNKTILKAGENEEFSAFLEYENLNSKSNWMKLMLPPGFWETDKKASMNVLLHRGKPTYSAEDSETRYTEFRLALPHHTMSLLGNSQKKGRQRQINMNLSKMNHKYQKLEAFLNFTCNYWPSETEVNPQKSVIELNVTVPRRSWSLTFQGEKDYQQSNNKKKKYEIKLKRFVLKPVDDHQSNYIGWWSHEISDQFTLEEKEVQLNIDLEEPKLSNEELHEKYFSTLAVEDMKDLYIHVKKCKATLLYPLRNRVESFNLDGFILISDGARTSRFQKTFDLTSSYNNLKLTSNSVYSTGMGSTILEHDSYFTHLPSQTKAFNIIRYTKKDPDDECRQITFKHDIRSHVFDLSTDATYKCEPDNQEQYKFQLSINTNSSKWNMLDMKLTQAIVDMSPDYSREYVTLEHMLGTVHVDAEWHGKYNKDHKKTVVVCSKERNCPNAELFLDMLHDGRTNLKLSFPNRNNSQIAYVRVMSPDYKNIHIKLGHSNNDSSFTEFFDFTGEIVAKKFHVWKGMIDVKTFAKVKELIVPTYQSVRDEVIAISKDANHPLNEILKPALRMTLYDWWKSVEEKVQHFWTDTWLEIKEVFFTLEAFTESTYALLRNSFIGLRNILRFAYNAIKEKSVTIWAIHYFNIPYYFEQGFTNLPQGLSELMQQLALHEESILNFKFITGNIMSLRTFREWPSISFYPSWLKNIFSSRDQVSSYSRLNEGEKLAMIFGPLHVYTFDEHLYDIPQYPQKDCVFLLTHDIHKSLFTVLSTQRGINILFPEMSIIIDDQNEIYINGSQTPSFLPIQASNGKVTVKRGKDVVEVWSPSLSVICSDSHFLCLIKLKEFHSGGVIGLLGNADEHVNNEFTLPNGNMTTKLDEFMKSYEVSGKSECKNLVLHPVSPASDEERNICFQEFGNSCYSSYAVRNQFFTACIADVKAGHGPCYAAAGLSALCHFKYIPSHTTCNVRKQESGRIKRNLEVVFVVQDSKYLTSPGAANAPLKGIESLVEAIDTKFKGVGYGSVNFSLVGFGGRGVHYAPSLHSIGKEVWLPADDMIKGALKLLEFKSKDDSSAVQALKYALEELGYDSFDSKVIIVITAKDRQVAEKSNTDFIRHHLEKNGIVLYTISSYPSIEKGKKVFGVRADGLIFSSQSQGGDSYLDYPRGSLAKLTASTRGSVFLSKFLRDNKPNSFFPEIAQEIWARINKESQKCRRCKTVKNVRWWYKNECTIVNC